MISGTTGPRCSCPPTTSSGSAQAAYTCLCGHAAGERAALDAHLLNAFATATAIGRGTPQLMPRPSAYSQPGTTVLGCRAHARPPAIARPAGHEHPACSKGHEHPACSADHEHPACSKHHLYQKPLLFTTPMKMPF
ncbi:MAG: hypothetical protein JWM19_596 [Actinomycetia bacterium]|nr:hypothetical protein [Actinomycetes bacterium]